MLVTMQTTLSVKTLLGVETYPPGNFMQRHELRDRA